MADTTAAISTGVCTPEVWSAKLNVNLDKYGKYNDIVNRKYEGEIKKAGDMVYFYTYGDLEVQNYTGSDLTFEDPETNRQELLIDQKKYIAFTIDEIDKVQSNVDLVNGYTNRMSVGFAQTKDLFIHNLAVAGAKEKMNNTAAVQVTKDDVWKTICDMYAILAGENAIIDGKDYAGKRPALVVTPQFEGILKQAPQYFSNAFGNEVLRKGQVGNIGGFDVFVNTNIANKGGEETIVALTYDAITFAEQIVETDIVKAENSFKHKVKALHVYGGKVANPACIVTNKVKYTA